MNNNIPNFQTIGEIMKWANTTHSSQDKKSEIVQVKNYRDNLFYYFRKVEEKGKVSYQLTMTSKENIYEN